MSKSLSVALCLTPCLMGSAALAKYCVKLPSCEELGYIFSYKEGRRSIRCPFDTSKVLYLDYCQAYGLSSKPSDEAGAYQECVEEKADGTKINTGYYRYTRCNSGYTYQSGNCIYSCASNKDYPLNAPATYCKTPTDSQAFNGVTCYSATCQQCEDGYDKDSAGTCWNCQADSGGIAYGLTLCGEGKVGNEKKAKAPCADKTYYEECLVVETCFYNYRPDSSCSYGVKSYNVATGNENCISSSNDGLEVVPTSNTCKRQGSDYTYYEKYQSCNTTGATCAGKKQCEHDEGATGETACVCGNHKYFNKCAETCEYNYRPDSSCDSGMKIYSISSSSENCIYSSAGGLEIVPSTNTCKRQGSDYTYYERAQSCNASGATCAGKKLCEFPGGSLCNCGNHIYGDYCLAQCNYEDTPETCEAKGMGFSLKCLTEDAKYGECIKS